MKITHCKLKKKAHKELLRFFVLEVTARSAADILSIHPNSAALFYRKNRQVIEHHLSLAADEIFDGRLNPMRAVSAAAVKADADAAQRGREDGYFRHSETALKIFGIRQSACCANTTELTGNPSRCS